MSKKLLYFIVALILLFIWGNSFVDGRISGAISNYIHDTFTPFLSSFLGNQGTTLSQSTGEGILRKLAHLAEFFILGVGLFFLLAPTTLLKLHQVLFYGLGIAVIDETIQLFIVGRTGQVKDIWIDFTGFCIGILACYLLRLFITNISMRRNQ